MWELESSIFPEYKKFSRGEFFLLFNLELKNTGFHFRKYKKSFLLRKNKKFFNLRFRNFHCLKYKEFFSGRIFFIFWAWVHLAAPCYTNSDIHDKQFLSFADELLGYYLKIVTHGLRFWSSFSWVNWKLKMRHSPNTSHSKLNKRSRRSRLSKLVLHYKFEEFWLLGHIS